MKERLIEEDQLSERSWKKNECHEIEGPIATVFYENGDTPRETLTEFIVYQDGETYKNPWRDKIKKVTSYG